MEENQSPKIKSFKNAMSLMFSSITTCKDETVDFTKNSIIVITAAGTIYGTPCIDLSKENNLDGKIFSTIYKQATDSTVTDVPRYCLILKDAIMISGNGFKQSFNTLFIFPEDIIAITLGDTSNI